MTQLASVEQVSSHVVRINFEEDLVFSTRAMSVGPVLLNTAEYTVTGRTVVEVLLPESQDQSAAAPPPPGTGGAPRHIYLLLDDEPSGNPTVTVNVLGNLVDWDGNLFVGGAGAGTPDSLVLTSVAVHTPSYWEGAGVRFREALKELRKLGRIRFQSSAKQPMAYGNAAIVGKINDVVSGAQLGKLGSAIDGPGTPTYLPVYGTGGFSLPGAPVPGVGSTFSFANAAIPCHVDKLWGRSNGENVTYRTSIPFHAFSCQLYIAARDGLGVETGLLESSEWFAPMAGRDRLIRLLNPLPSGATIIAVYTPRQSLIQIGKEIIAYQESDLSVGTAVICGRSQLLSELQTHAIGDEIKDVWCAGFVERVKYALLAFGASGRALEYIGMDAGSPREDNPSLDDTSLRRMIFHTSVTMRGTVNTVKLAIRYMFPDLWSHVIVDEDPRWPGCIVIWYSAEQLHDFRQPDPPIECWETWLDHTAWPDGFDASLYAATFYRDDGVDAAPYGDYYEDGPADGGAFTMFPVVLYGPEIGLLGTLSGTIPPPYVTALGTLDATYKTMLQRPEPLDKVLAAGCGVLLLDYGLL